MPRQFVKDPDSVLDYVFDFAASTNGTGTGDWLAAGETISAKTVTADTGITIDSSALTDANTSVTVWLSSGTEGIEYGVSCLITTTAARKVERTIKVQVEER